jgi:hypothetical protein
MWMCEYTNLTVNVFECVTMHECVWTWVSECVWISEYEMCNFPLLHNFLEKNHRNDFRDFSRTGSSRIYSFPCIFTLPEVWENSLMSHITGSCFLFFVCWFWFCFVFLRQPSSEYPCCPGTHSVDQADLRLREPPVFASWVLGLKVCAMTACLESCFSYAQVSSKGQTRSSAFASFQSVMKLLCKDQESFLSNSNMFINLPRVNELLEDNKEKFNIPHDSSKTNVTCIM